MREGYFEPSDYFGGSSIRTLGTKKVDPRFKEMFVGVEHIEESFHSSRISLVQDDDISLPESDTYY